MKFVLRRCGAVGIGAVQRGKAETIQSCRKECSRDPLAELNQEFAPPKVGGSGTAEFRTFSELLRTIRPRTMSPGYPRVA